MKIFTLRNILGAAAIYGVVQYAKKKGGFANAYNELLANVKELGHRTEMGTSSGGVGSSTGSMGSSTSSSGVSGRSGTLDDQRTGYGSSGTSGYPGSTDRKL
jgi:hypothetical protein